MTRTITLSLFLAIILPHMSLGFWCYVCDSAQGGCGQELDIRLQHWEYCDGEPSERVCVKLFEKIGSQVHITRGCMHTMKKSTAYRLDMPTTTRHNYCLSGRTSGVARGQAASPDNSRIYCFCNDWNGCNPASHIKSHATMISVLATITAFLLWWLH